MVIFKMKAKIAFQSTTLRILLFVFLLEFYGDAATIPTAEYAIVFDAGSSGTRAVAYKFIRNSDGQLDLQCVRLRRSKGGLSSYADKPTGGAELMENLLEEVKDFVPGPFRAKTQLVLKATAGLRLIEKSKSEHLLEAVHESFEVTGFKIPEHSVEIMTGTNEGLNSWLAVNILTKTIKKGHSYAVLDLGGASTQVTYSKEGGVKLSDLFTVSYLNLGINAIHHAVFTDSIKAGQKKKTHYISECLHPGYQNQPFEYGNDAYLISGASETATYGEQVVNYEKCVGVIKAKINAAMKQERKPEGLAKQEKIAAFNYFFHAAKMTELITNDKEGVVTVEAFTEKAKEVCGKDLNSNKPFLCMDLIYISELLTGAYGLKGGKKIHLYNEIGGNEVTWTLGCAYRLLEPDH